MRCNRSFRCSRCGVVVGVFVVGVAVGVVVVAPDTDDADDAALRMLLPLGRRCAAEQGAAVVPRALGPLSRYRCTGVTVMSLPVNCCAGRAG